MNPAWSRVTMNATAGCHDNGTSQWEEQIDRMYAYFYLLLFLSGLPLNTVALWVLCRHISKKTKAVIFMINLAFADLAHTLSLPLRIYYYFSHDWPFGHAVCLLCFYLKYLNMYAAIMFLVCISMQRCFFLLKPFSARRWRRRYDLLISFVVWVVVGLGCSTFILMRSSPRTELNTTRVNRTAGCFKDLPMRRVSPSVAVMMITLGELFGFLLPLVCISYSSFRIARSLTKTEKSEKRQSSRLSRLYSDSSSGEHASQETQAKDEKRRALRMVLSCSGLFLFCFGPYHMNFLLYLLVSQGIVRDCRTQLAVGQFHPVSLCIANVSCCLNPVLYYFLTAEFRQHFTKRTSSFSGTLMSSPLSSPSNTHAPNNRPRRMDSSLSNWD